MADDVSFEVKEKELKRIIRYATRMLGLHHITGPEEYLSLYLIVDIVKIAK